MRESLAPAAPVSTGKQGSALPFGAIGCPNIHAIVARARWPKKTAEHWAAAAGVKPRMAKYWLAGRHAVSDAGKLALIRELS